MRSIALVSAVVLVQGIFTASLAQDLSAQRVKNLQELQTLQSEISLSEQRKQELANQIDSLEKDRATINRTLIETSTNSRNIEKRISKVEIRLSQLRDEQADVRVFLNSKKALLMEVLGALQRMGRNPPPALLVKPEDALSSVRSAILLGSVVPEMRSETEILLGQLKDLVRISNEIETQREALTVELVSLAGEEEKLNLLLIEKRKLAGQAQDKLLQENAKAAELAAKATSLNDLINSLEVEIESAQQAAEAARLAEIEQKRLEEQRIATGRTFEKDEAFSDPGRTAPAISFAAAKGLLPQPVEGFQLASFGQNDGAGDKTKGISLEARENVRVISPADAWVVYAGPFRSYGQLLIMNAGQGYHIVLAGMEKINIQPGQFVLLGEPIGTMGAQRIASAGLVDVNTTKPILYVEFRKDGKSIDPNPWWSDNNKERTTDGS
jgi:septal ring factor EnvC (AmiA/AmiB activator)